MVQRTIIRLRVVPRFSSGIVERAKRGHVSSFLAWGDFHARSRFARSTILEEKWGTTGSLEDNRPRTDFDGLDEFFASN